MIIDLAQNDGATIDEAYFYVKDIEEYIMFDLFHNIEKKMYKNLRIFSEDFPEQSLVIGEIQEE